MSFSVTNVTPAFTGTTTLDDAPSTTAANVGWGTQSDGDKISAIANLQSQKNNILTSLSDIDFNSPDAMVQFFVAQTKMNALDKMEQTVFKAEEQDQARYKQVVDGIQTR